MTGLLVSVRSAAEAEAALRGGAGLIDVKEPANGPLGRASAVVVAAVVRAVAGRRPVSAALGELAERSDDRPVPLPAGLAYVKVGLSGLGGARDWARRLSRAAEEVEAARPPRQFVAVAYADHGPAGSPRPDDVCAYACERGRCAFLVDTWTKGGGMLLDWLSRPKLEGLLARCRAAGVPVALAGSLGPDEIRALAPLRPDWFAVRGAACKGRDRTAAVDEHRVRELAGLVLRAAASGS
jgi:uncharacterized protein (UPF0264 family)